MNDGVTALMVACRNGDLEVVRLLLESGAHNDLAMNNGTTALMAESRRGHLEVVQRLLESGANRDLALTPARRLLWWHVKEAILKSFDCF